MQHQKNKIAEVKKHTCDIYLCLIKTHVINFQHPWPVVQRCLIDLTMIKANESSLKSNNLINDCVKLLFNHI